MHGTLKKPSKTKIELKRLQDRQRAWWSMDGYEYQTIKQQTLKAALATGEDPVWLAVEHLARGPSEQGSIKLGGGLWGNKFTRAEAEQKEHWRCRADGTEGWTYNGPVIGWLNAAYSFGYRVLIGSPERGFTRPTLTVPDEPSGFNQPAFNKWLNDDYGPRVYQRSELAIWPKTEFKEEDELFGRLFGKDVIVETTATISGRSRTDDVKPFDFWAGWRQGSKGVDEHGNDVQIFYRFVRRKEEEVGTVVQGQFKPPPKPPEKPQKERDKPLIVQVAEKLWGPAEARPVAHTHDTRFQYHIGRVVIDPMSREWFDLDSNRSGTMKDLRRMLQAKDPERSNPISSSVLVCASDVIMKPKQWIWKGHLLRGAQELFSRIGGLGKSQVQIDWVARATTGTKWPDGSDAVGPMDVIMLTAEDTLDQEVVPRLRAAEADLKRVHFLKAIKKDEELRQFLLAEDLALLEQMAAHIKNVGLICVDPITAFMGGRMNANSATEVRSQLGPLKDFAERSNIGMSTITHPAKAAGVRAIDHFINSAAFIHAGRIGHLVVEEVEVDPDTGERTPTRRVLFCNVKNNAYKNLMPTLAFRREEVVIEKISEWEEITAPRAIWSENSLGITADQAIAAVSGKIPDAQPRVQTFLRDLLRNGPMPVTQIQIEANRQQFTEDQLRTAKDKMKLVVAKTGMDGVWTWALPEREEDGL